MVSTLADEEPVVAFELDGDARAYPLQVLIWHEIVNDTVAGVPVTVTYCPLCNTAVVYDRRHGDRVRHMTPIGPWGGRLAWVPPAEPPVALDNDGRVRSCERVRPSRPDERVWKP